MPNVLMVFPRFNQHSFWNLQAVCDTYGSRAQSPPLGLMTVAALLPRRLERAARRPQRGHAARRRSRVGRHGDDGRHAPAARGYAAPSSSWRMRTASRSSSAGLTPMSSPEDYADADFRVLGEAEGLIDAFHRGVGRRRALRHLRGREVQGRRDDEPGAALRSRASSSATRTWACSSRAAARSTASSATSSSCTAACRAPRPTSRCSPSCEALYAPAIAGTSTSSTTTSSATRRR